MADIVQSLFGVTPEMYQQRQAQQADAAAQQYAQLSPMQQAQAGIYRGAYGLAGALGGQDPQLRLISARNSIAKQIDYNNPESIMQGVQALSQAGDTVGAMQLADVARKMESEMAQQFQRKAAGQASLAQAGRERVQATPEKIQLAREVALLSGPEGSPEYNTAYATSLRGQTEPKEPRGVAFGTDREAIAAELYNASFASLTPEQRAAVNKRVEAEQGRKAAAGAAKLVLPGEKALADVPAFRASVQRTIEPQLKAITATDQALQSITDSIATNNFVSFNAARTQLAKSLGDSQLSRRDIEQAGGDPSILGGLIDLTSKAFTSTPGLDTQKKIQSTLQAIRAVAQKQAQGEVDQQRKIALRSPGYNAESVTEALTFPQLQAPASAPTTAAAAVYARNPSTNERIVSTDGGKTWTPAR